MRACELFEGTLISEDFEVGGIFTDSRKIIPNSVFVCLKGTEENGHQYANEAAERGARLIVAEEEISAPVQVIYKESTVEALSELAERFYGYPADKLKLIGVTGTNGKTTVTFLIKSILEAAGQKTGVIGTNKCFVGDEELDFESNMPTTPNSLELAYIFSEMQKRGAKYVAMEVSSHALALKRVNGLKFDVGVFTNLSRDHLDFHKTMQDYAKTKAKLFDMTAAAVINTDSGTGLKIAAACKCPVVTVGLNEDADISASQICLGGDYVSFVCTENETPRNLRLGIPGKFSVYNALCAVGTAHALGIDYDDIKAGLAAVSNVKGRVELVPTDTDYKVFIDYAHSPDGLLNILNTAKGFTKGRVIAVFGCGGDRDITKRPVMGKIAGDLADFSVITSDNPRCENPVKIIEEIKEGIDRTAGEYIIIVNRREAIEYALKNAKKGDTVLLCGKGQETYQIIGKKKYHFDEREIIKEILNK